jgi:hypothetical protein
MPTARYQAAAAMASNVMYVVGGYPGAAPTTVGTLVETYSVLTDTWATGRQPVCMSVWCTGTLTHARTITHTRARISTPRKHTDTLTHTHIAHKRTHAQP